MKQLSFRNYPPNLLTGFCIAVITIYFIIKWIVANGTGDITSLRNDILILISSAGVVTLVFSLINKWVMWGPYLKLLGLTDIRGRYEGTLISSYFVDNDPSKGYITKHIVLEIAQNINGFSVSGAIYDDTTRQSRSSSFTSSHEAMEQDDHGLFEIRYQYSNEGAILHPDTTRYGLNNHKGYTILLFDPETQSFRGSYFNHERESRGTIRLFRKS